MQSLQSLQYFYNTYISKYLIISQNIVDTLDIVGNADIIGNVDIVDIVDCWLLKQSGTRLSSIEAIPKMLLNHSILIMGLRDASASKNYNTDKQGNDFLDFCDRLDNNRNLKRCFCHSDLGGGFTWPVGQTEASQGGANHTLCHTGANHTVCKAKPCLNISDTEGNQDAWKECVLGQRTTFDCMNANHVSSIFSVQSTVRIISQNYEVE